MPEIEHVLLQYETGKITTETFIWNIQHYTKTRIAPNRIIEQWNSLLVDLPFSRLEMLNRLARHFNISLLSNINELHIEVARKYVWENYGIQHFEQRFFHHHFYSNEIGFRKPQEEAYMFVKEVLDISPENILFIDDLQENIAAAKMLGWNTVRHDPSAEISTLIDHYLTSY